MSVQAGFALQGRNPDILTCIANLSNDEVFTPPEFANQMLDQLAIAWAADNAGANIWEDPTVTFLDPFTKSGVFLREITSRLIDGLATEIPDLEERVDHILTKQIFGIAITQLTALIARRTLYCSKAADGQYSVGKSFDTADGNIWFQKTEHDWVGATTYVETSDTKGAPVRVGTNGKCRYCGASQRSLDRGDVLETHAYSFIHTDDIHALVREMFGEDMQFDVIIGNPPYQLDTGGSGKQARPLYHLFVEQAKKLEPRFLCMVIPARWFAGGMGLGDFRNEMLHDDRIRQVVDFISDRDAFPGVNINGGVCYFLWDRENRGPCQVTTVAPGGAVESITERQLDEFGIFVRRSISAEILRKVQSLGEEDFASRVFPIDPFGFPTKFHGAERKTPSRDVLLFGSGRKTWISRTEINKNENLVDRWKVLVAQATDGNEKYPLPIWDLAGPFVASPGEVCSWTYLVAYEAENEAEAQRVVEYMRTKFFRFLVSLRKATQHNKAENFSFVPLLPMNRSWTDEDLYSRYALNAQEIEFVESNIRTMGKSDE